MSTDCPRLHQLGQCTTVAATRNAGPKSAQHHRGVTGRRSTGSSVKSEPSGIVRTESMLWTRRRQQLRSSHPSSSPGSRRDLRPPIDPPLSITKVAEGALEAVSRAAARADGCRRPANGGALQTSPGPACGINPGRALFHHGRDLCRHSLHSSLQ